MHSEGDILELYQFYKSKLILDLKEKCFSEQILICEKLGLKPVVFDFCGIVRKLNYFEEVYIVYDYKLCYEDLKNRVEECDLAIFLIDKYINVRCFEQVDDCNCILCRVEHALVLINYF